MNRKFFIKVWICLFCFSSTGLFAQAEPNVEAIFRSVVLVRNESYSAENKIEPWKMKSINTEFGSGLVLEGNLILTNAHVIMDSKRIVVRTGFSKKDYVAQVKAIGYDCDLALLSVEDPEFKEETSNLPFADSYPILGSELLVLGFPNGQENLTVEKGSVLRYEKNRYSFSGLDFRNVIKINANIQPGNSGGPAIQNGQVVGLAFQISTLGKDIAYLIPNEIILHFLKDLGDSKYDGFPNLGFTFQSGLPLTLKKAMKIPVSESGIFLNRIYPNSSFSNSLKERDFLTSIDGFAISNEGEVLREGKKEPLIEYIERFQMGTGVLFELYRNGKKFQTSSNLKKNVSLGLYRDSPDDHFIQSGLVFQPISKSFFGFEDGDLDSSLKYHYSYFIQDMLFRFVERDIVLSYIFDDPETSKYKKFKFKVVESINGYVPKDLNDFKKAWKENEKNFIVLKFRGLDQTLVFDSDAIRKINIRTRKRYGAIHEEL